MTTGDADVVYLGSNACYRLPRPWTCSLDHGHLGPCQATRDPKVSERSTLIESPSYTDYQPGFGLYKEQREIIDRWMEEHDKARHMPPGRKFRYAGAIGGAYTYEFTSTSLGTCVGVRCSCGERIDVSDYDNW